MPFYSPCPFVSCPQTLTWGRFSSLCLRLSTPLAERCTNARLRSLAPNRARLANCTIRQPRCRRVYGRPHGTAPLRHCAAAQLYDCTIVQPRNPTFWKLLEAAQMDSQAARNDRRQQLYKGVWIWLVVSSQSVTGSHRRARCASRLGAHQQQQHQLPTRPELNCNNRQEPQQQRQLPFISFLIYFTKALPFLANFSLPWAANQRFFLSLRE